MSEILQVAVTQIESMLTMIAENMSEFMEINSEAFLEEIGNLETMNSDYITKFIYLLETLKDERAEELVDYLEAYTQEAGDLLNDLKEIDREYQTGMEVRKDGTNE